MTFALLILKLGSGREQDASSSFSLPLVLVVANQKPGNRIEERKDKADFLSFCF